MNIFLIFVSIRSKEFIWWIRGHRIVLKSYNQTSAFIQDKKNCSQSPARNVPGSWIQKGLEAEALTRIDQTVASGRRHFSCFPLISKYTKSYNSIIFYLGSNTLQTVSATLKPSSMRALHSKFLKPNLNCFKMFGSTLRKSVRFGWHIHVLFKNRKSMVTSYTLHQRVPKCKCKGGI